MLKQIKVLAIFLDGELFYTYLQSISISKRDLMNLYSDVSTAESMAYTQILEIGLNLCSIAEAHMRMCVMCCKNHIQLIAAVIRFSR